MKKLSCLKKLYLSLVFAAIIQCFGGVVHADPGEEYPLLPPPPNGAPSVHSILFGF